jgi:putative hydrolase of the HAD superfamily
LTASAVPGAVLLDALGTLVELEPPAPRLCDELAARFGVNVTLAEAAHAIGAEIAYYSVHLNEGRDAAALAGLRLRCAGVLRDSLPADARTRLPGADAMVEPLLASLHFRAFADALVALPGLREDGCRLVVVSNWDLSLHEVLERVGLASLLDGILTSAEVGARKPDVAIFERALRMAGVPAVEALHVGDSVAEDVAGARAAGIEPVLVRRDGGAGPDGVRTIATLDALL